jgi:hypothetical protein
MPLGDPTTGTPDRHHADVIITASETTFDEYPDLIFKCVSTENTHDELDTPDSENIPERPSRVRFRSRVRITSGLNRHRHTTSYSEQDAHQISFSRSSSLSGSPSSSISAPLRNQAEDEVGKPGWGTLGQRVSILAQGNQQRRKQREQQEQALLAKSVQLGISIPTSQQYSTNERTPLINSSSRYSRLRRNSEPFNSGNDSREDEADRLARDVDLVFGPWPIRLWNHHVRRL